ncbi:MAG: choice-of-anchor N protein [bacterium]|nr:choice-of-anchor N protein [bacterium]
MRNFLLATLALLLVSASAFAVPDLQLYAPGSTYQTSGDDPETWIINSASFDLYVIGKAGINDVLVSMALEGFGENDDVSGVSIVVNGVAYNNFVWGVPPMATLESTRGDLSKHGVFPAWYAEFDAGDFAAMGGIDDCVGGSYDPLIDGYLANSNTLGQYRSFSIEVIGAAGAHFDAYNLKLDNRGNTVIDKFAPFSHDAASHGYTPEPATMLLFGLGLAGGAISRRFSKK